MWLFILTWLLNCCRVNNDFTRIYTRLPDGSHCIKMVIYTAAVQEAQPNWLYTRLPDVNIKLLFTRQSLAHTFLLNVLLLLKELIFIFYTSATYNKDVHQSQATLLMTSGFQRFIAEYTVCCKLLTLSNQMSRFIDKCIRKQSYNLSVTILRR